MKLKWMGIAAALGLLAISAAVAGETATVTDMAGRWVESPRNPDRIICLGPGALRLIVYLKAQDRVVGIEEMEKLHPQGRPYRIAHPDLADLPRIGPGGPAAINKKPDLEAVLQVRPEVIFATCMDPALADEIQRILGIPVAVLSYGEPVVSDEAIFVALRTAGTILGRSARADAAVDYIQSLKKDLQERTRNIPEEKKPAVYVGGIGHRGAHGIESTDPRYLPLDWLNWKNGAESVDSRIGGHLFVDKEMLLALNPEVIFVDGGGLALVEEDYRKKPALYKALKAFQTRRMHALLPYNHYAANIDTALADAYAIGKILYPERFQDIDVERKADEIYAFLVGEPVYSKMKRVFGAIGRKMEFSE